MRLAWSQIRYALETPVYIDRRWPWNAERRRRVRRESGILTHHDDAEMHRAAMQGISVLKLMAVIAGGISPLLIIFYFFISSFNENAMARNREIMVKEMDGRYVMTVVDNVRMAEHDTRINENTNANRSQEARLTAIEVRLQQMQNTLDQIHEEQKRARR